MNEYVTDTHSLLWYLTNSQSLGKNASAAFEEGKNGQALIHVPAIVIAELYYLNIKWKYIKDFSAEFGAMQQGSQFVFVPFDASDVLDFDRDSAVKEMHDRIIVGVARRLGAPVITKDQVIVTSQTIKTVW